MGASTLAIYEYKCKSCEATVTIARSISEEEKIPMCSTCKTDYTRVYSNVGVTFNGGGFYSTDKGK